MSAQQEIRRLKNREIDYAKWDDCIQNAANGNLYAKSWYLDVVSPEWEALIWDDYEFVMPLPYRKKLGISYLYQPLYCQQLGIFPKPPADIAMEFFNTITQNYSYFDIQLNASNLPPKNFRKIQPLPRKNFLLHLGTDYEVIYSGYSTNTKRNLAKASKNNLGLLPGISLEEYMKFKAANLPVKLSAGKLKNLRQLIAFGQHKGFGRIYGVYSPANELCAAVYFCRFKERVIYMNAVSNEQGKKLGAMPFLIDNFIRENADRNLTIDFEGSMIPGVARFYEGFGASPETYYRIRSKRLPFPIKLLRYIKS